MQYVVDEDPRYRGGEARTLLAVALASMGREEQGRSLLEAAARQDQNPEAVVRFAQLLIDSDEKPRAKELLEALIERGESMSADRRHQESRWLKSGKDLLEKL